MTFFLVLLSLPFIYVICTALIALIFNANPKKKLYKAHDFIYNIILEGVLQCIVFIMLPIDLLRKWDVYEGNKNKMVILLPGYTETQFIFYKLKKRLLKRRIGYKTLRYKPFLGDLESQVEVLEFLISNLINENPDIDIYLVGHSMGGLVGRKYLESYENQIKKLIMISTPQKGTLLAKLALGNSATDFKPNSKFVKSLKNSAFSNVLNIYSEGDNLIVPSSSLQYYNKNFILKNNLLHNSTMFSNESIHKMLCEIEGQ